MKLFSENEFEIWFKPRPDEKLTDQLDSYQLGDLQDKVKILELVTPDAMADIDIIGGTQTTLLYDLLPYNKLIWILETAFRLQDDMIQQGLARLIRLENMDCIEAIYNEEINTPRKINQTLFSGNQPVVDVLHDLLDRRYP